MVYQDIGVSEDKNKQTLPDPKTSLIINKNVTIGKRQQSIDLGGLNQLNSNLSIS